MAVSKVLFLLSLQAFCLSVFSSEVKMYKFDENNEKKIDAATEVVIQDADILSIKFTPVYDTGMKKEFGCLTITLSENGGKINNTFTTKYKDQRISVFIDGVFISSPMVIEPTTTSIFISSSLEKTELKKLEK
jgi:preprotein translocase subunit SecD